LKSAIFRTGSLVILFTMILLSPARATDLYSSTYELKIESSDNPSSKSDSLPNLITIEKELVKPKVTKLAYKNHFNDSIRKSSDKNIGNLRFNGLSNLKTKGEKNFLSRNLLAMIIRENRAAKELLGVNSSLYFTQYNGKKIGKIRFLQLEIWGPSMEDTLGKATQWISKLGNNIHTKTSEKRLMSQLLFNSGELINPKLMAENEKFIRDQPYIQDVAITLSYSKTEPETVDVLVIIKEKFEYGIKGDLSSTTQELELTDQNMFGLGHQLSVRGDYYPTETKQWGGSFKYQISNLDRKFIQLGLEYTDDYTKNQLSTFIEKRFIASRADWAGGINIDRVFSDHFATPYSYTRLDTAVSSLNTDVWYGRRLENNSLIFGNTILSGRHVHEKYFENQSILPENSIFRSHDFFLGAIGFSKRDLFKDNRVYGYGVTEDIPYGRYAEMAAGFDLNSTRIRPYFHLNYSRAMITKSGSYFKWKIGLGGYLHDSSLEQGAMLLSGNYFSNFVHINSHPYRFFINFELLSGINRYPEEQLMVNHKFGVRDYFSLQTKATNRLKFNIETVRFWEWHQSGFRFAHYFFADGACLSNDMSKIFNDSFIGGVGVGLRIHNESLVFNVLEIRLSWIPIAPQGTTPYIFNMFGQPKSKFEDFLGGKPREINYQ
jgi:hypothetical protein